MNKISFSEEEFKKFLTSNLEYYHDISISPTEGGVLALADDTCRMEVLRKGDLYEKFCGINVPDAFIFYLKNTKKRGVFRIEYQSFDTYRGGREKFQYEYTNGIFYL